MSGIVYLVGAGPGDPGLMTRRSLELIAAADAILYDRLIPPGALDGARPDALLRYVGKEPGAAALTQDETNALLVVHFDVAEIQAVDRFQARGSRRQVRNDDRNMAEACNHEPVVKP